MRNKTYVNGTEYRVVGLSRSGTHAVINWLLAQVEGRYCFLNCAEPKSNPFHTARPLDTGLPYEANFDDFELEREQAGEFSHKDVLLHGYEDCFLGMVCNKEAERQHDAFVGASARRIDVLILRDPFNLFASRKKAGIYRGAPAGEEVATWRTIARIWKQHAKAFTREHNYFTQPLVTINYNRWARDAAYRRALAGRLRLSFSDAGFHSVPAVARGSSFDGTQFHGRPEKMDVLERWRHFKDDPSFWNLFEDDVVRLSKEIFGLAPGA
ncbi:MAG TPA: hypothetical protein VFL45_08060 [Gammaproteobacteria bacterium]|jgi:hypothetical protein|nr:hypothetical protein [Gammaproteobacteria bacterium]